MVIGIMLLLIVIGWTLFAAFIQQGMLRRVKVYLFFLGTVITFFLMWGGSMVASPVFGSENLWKDVFVKKCSCVWEIKDSTVSQKRKQK